MARYFERIQLDKPDDFVLTVMNNYLQKNGFIVSDLKNETVYRAGNRFWDGYRYLKWSYVNGVLNLEAWLAGPFGLEYNLTGILLYDRKTLYHQSLEDLRASLQQIVPVHSVDNERMAVISLLLGILALIIMNPVFCLIFAILSVTLAEIGLKSNKSGLAKAGRICATVSLLTTSIISLMNLYIQFI